MQKEPARIVLQVVVAASAQLRSEVFRSQQKKLLPVWVVDLRLVVNPVSLCVVGRALSIPTEI